VFDGVVVDGAMFYGVIVDGAMFEGVTVDGVAIDGIGTDGVVVGDPRPCVNAGSRATTPNPRSCAYR
jgi:hypothetical protein